MIQREGVSVIIPAHNEEQELGKQIEEIREVMAGNGWSHELIVVDDGSTDKTAEEAERHPVRLIRLQTNRGYGAALKAGIAAANYDWVLITDADGTYPPKAIPSLLAKAGEYDMVVGARIGENVHMPVIRRLPKWFLSRLASFLVEQPIPDLNSGLRVIRKSLVEEFKHLLPSGFSFTGTITMSLLCNDYRVFYQPIDYYKRVGSSKFRVSDVFQFFLLILRTVVYFNPLRVFIPLGGVLFLAGFAKFFYDAFGWHISASAVMGILGGMIIWAVGLLADQISRVALKAK